MGDQALGPYRLGGVLAELPLGQLVSAADPARRSPLVALLVDPALAGENRLRGELRIAVARAGGLRHPSIARPIDIRDADGRLAIVYEAPATRSLAARLTDPPPLDGAQAIAIIRALADGLDAAHARALVHGLLAPSSVLVGPDHAPVVVGMGLLAAVETTGLADLLGEHADLRYIAPEQAAGQRAVQTADGYALAVLARYMLAGEQVSAARTVLARQDSAVPSERYPSCRTFADAMSDALRGTASVEPAPPPEPATSQPATQPLATPAPVASAAQTEPKTWPAPEAAPIPPWAAPAPDDAPPPPAAPYLTAATDAVESTPELRAGLQRARALALRSTAVPAVLTLAAITFFASSWSGFNIYIGVTTLVFAALAALRRMSRVWSLDHALRARTFPRLRGPVRLVLGYGRSNRGYQHPVLLADGRQMKIEPAAHRALVDVSRYATDADDPWPYAQDRLIPLQTAIVDYVTLTYFEPGPVVVEIALPDGTIVYRPPGMQAGNLWT